jgi:hypothetical protein
MDRGHSDLENLRGTLRARRAHAWVWAIFGPKHHDQRQLLWAQAVVGRKPEAWEQRLWTYGGYTFVSGRVSASTLARALASDGPQNIKIGGIGGTITLPVSSFSWERKPSLARYEQLALTWPSAAYDIPVAVDLNANFSGSYLIGEGESPSFPTLGAAFNAFVHNDYTVSGAQNPQLNAIKIRLVDQTACIRRVRIHAASIDVWVAGRFISGTQIELNGTQYRHVAEISRSGRTSLALPTGLPSDAWLWLKRGHDWLDYRSLGYWGGYRSPDVENDLPHDPIADLTSLASQGEGPALEYKQKLPDTAREKRTVFKTITAFANGSGGIVVFGIDDDNNICGVSGDPPEQCRRLTDMLRDLITPTPDTRIDTYRLEGRNVIVLTVSPGAGVLHALTIDDNKPEYYIRREASTFYARPDEVTAIVARGNDSSTRFPWQ